MHVAKNINILTKIVKQLVVFLLLWLCFSIVNAQYVFNTYTTDDGLMSNEVTCTFRDSRGFVWIGTKEGLQVYNGRYFRELRRHLLDSNSLSGDWIFSIAEDNKGFIWAGTDRGICKIHPGHLSCKRYEPGRNMVADINTSYSSLVSDEQGIIWAGTTNAILKLQKDSFICTDRLNFRGHIYKGAKDELLITMFNSVLVKNAKTGTTVVHENSDIKKIDYTSAYTDVRGNYWVGSWAEGLKLYNNEWELLQSFKWDLMPVNPSTTNIVTGITGNDHFVYVVVFSCVYVYDLTNTIDLTNPTNRILYKADTEHGVSSDVINHIFIDDYNNIWLASANGLNVSLALNREYKQIAEGTGFITDLAWNKGQLIASSWYGKGIYFFDSTLSIQQTVQYLPENIRELDNSQISGLDMADDKNLWVATFNGLVQYSLEQKRSINYFTKEKSGLATNALNDVWFNETDNEVWTANYNNGISQMNISTGKVVNLNEDNHPILTNGLVWSFYDDEKSIVWILTNLGVCNYDYHKKKWNGWREITFNGNKISIGRCSAICSDSRGIVWLGTDNGLFIYANDEWFFKGLENGLPEREVNGIAEDKKGNMWFSFNNSLVNFEMSSLSSFILSSNNDILLPPINFIFIDPDNDGLYVVSENGMYAVNKDNILATHTASPKVYLEQFLINGKSYYSVTDSFNLEKTKFSFDENNVEISFITPCIGEIGNLLYSYRIGAAGKWSAPSENNRIVLPKLLPGSYQIEIRATTDGTHWSNEPLKISFVIRPPFWSTWWFRGLIVLGLLVFVIWWVRYLSTRKMRRKIIQLEKERAVDKERSRLSRDMHDDLGSGLTKISILSEVVKKKVKENGEVDNYLENISDSSRELMQNLNNIIWSLNPGNDTMQALLAYIREYTARFLESCEVEFEMNSLQITNDKEVSEQVKRNIFLVIKEALNNAIKHGKSTKILLKTELKGESEIRFSILDNGKGMDMGIVSKGNGLKNMEKRMKEIGGTFLLESKAGSGTSIILTYRF